MRVRLVDLHGEHSFVDGASADPPTVGKCFTLLVLALDRLVVTSQVVAVDLDRFLTIEGNEYLWSRVVGEA